MTEPCDFAELIGPILWRSVDGRRTYAIRVAEKHRNEAGTMHGGALAALIDETIGNMVRDIVGRRHVTLRITTTFMRRVEVGDLVEPDCEIVRTTRSMTFVEAKLRVGTEIVVTASLIFKALSPAMPEG